MSAVCTYKYNVKHKYLERRLDLRFGVGKYSKGGLIAVNYLSNIQ